MFASTASTGHRTLTDYEQEGFRTLSNLADGHAYQELNASQAQVVDELAITWRESEQQSIPQSVEMYVQRFARLINSPALPSAGQHLVLPTASNSIELVSAYLAEAKKPVYLTFPTFDNLALILRRRGVSPQPIETDLAQLTLQEDSFEKNSVLFLVNPNNPTGRNMGEIEFEDIVKMCCRRSITLVIDASFRLFYRQTYDMYALLSQSDVSFAIFEDTGKVFPSQDMKASLLTCSKDLASGFNALYNEVYLCVSKFTLMVLGNFFNAAKGDTLERSVHSMVAQRRADLRSRLDEKHIGEINRSSQIGVEWIDLASIGRPDTEIVSDLQNRGLSVLPGRHFYWSDALPRSESHIRVSLMKPQSEFYDGIKTLLSYLSFAG